MNTIKKVSLYLALAVILIGSSFVWADQSQTATAVYTLEQCLELGYQNSQDLQAANKNIEIAQESVNQAHSSFLPTVTYEAGYTKNSSDGIAGWVPVNPPDYSEWMPVYSSDTNASGSVSVNFSLYNGGKLTNSLKLALLQVESAKEDLRSTKQQVTYNIKSAFYSVWLAEQQLKVAKTSYDNLGQHYQEIDKYVQIGSKSKYDSLKAEVAWKAQKTKVIAAQNQVKIAKLNLATIIGIDKEKDFGISVAPSESELPQSVSLTLPSALDEAYRQRSDIRQSLQTIEIAKTNLEIVKADYKPIVSLSGAYQGQGTDLGINDWEKGWQIKLGLSGTIYNGNKTASKIKAAQQNVELATIQDRKTRDQIRQSLQTNLLTLEDDLETATANQASVGLAKESLRMTQIRFAAGMATTLDVKDAQLSLDEAEDGYYQSVASYFTDLAKIEMAMGRD